MPTDGTVTIEVSRSGLRGASWMDHEFGTTFRELPAGLGLVRRCSSRDGTDVMPSSSAGAMARSIRISSGTLVPVAGQPKRLGPADFTLTPGRRWIVGSERRRVSGRMADPVAVREARSAIKPVLDAQELVGARTGIRYWEGAIQISRALRDGIRFAAVATWS